MMILGIVVKEEDIEYDDANIDFDEVGMRDEIWAEHAKGLLKAELKRRGLGYRELAERLTAMGSPETERNLTNKISRGGFTAAFLLQALRAIGCDSIDISYIPEDAEKV